MRFCPLPPPGARSMMRFASSSSPVQALPAHARVVVIGGGIIGCSVAYHLAHMGWGKDVLLLERSSLTSGTTWHAAGLITRFGSKSRTSTDFRIYSRELYQKLEAETGQATGFSPCGFIELAAGQDRLEEFRRVAAYNRACGVPVEEISPAEVKRLFPLCKTEDLSGGFWVKDDGRVNPVDVTMALAKGARQLGARLAEGVSVASVTTRGGRASGVTTSDGQTVAADVVVNCAGMWARQLGEAAGVTVPNQAAEHYYLITEKMQDVDPAWPVIEDPSSYTYIRPEAGGLMVGLFEAKAAPWSVRHVPDKFAFGEIEPDWERMSPYVEKAMSRVPRVLTAGIKKFFCGPESFTPDLAPIIGEAPELRGYFVAAGLNSIGILTGGGVGRLLASWVVNGKPDMDVTGVHPARFQTFHSTPAYRAARVSEALGRVYALHYPFKGPTTARGLKRSPVHERHVTARARFRDVSGWEGADWFHPPGAPFQAPELERHTFGRPQWFALWEREHRAVRSGAGLIDMSFMTKLLVCGRDAPALLNRLSTADVASAAVPHGTITYTQWLDEAGRMQADVTVTKLAPGSAVSCGGGFAGHDDGLPRFLVIATDTAHRAVQSWLARHTPADAHVFTADVTGGLAQLNLQGPLSRQVLSAAIAEGAGGHGADAAASAADAAAAFVSNAAFPFRAVRDIAIGYARVSAARITYVGELGFELVVPSEMATHVYDRLVQAGLKLGAAAGAAAASAPQSALELVGLKALASLRMEKAYRDFGHDMDNTDTLLEVGLGFTAAMDKPGGFIGRDAVAAQKAKGLSCLQSRLVQVLCKDPTPLMFHGEVLLRDGVAVGDVRAAAYGHTLGGAVGLAMVNTPSGGPGLGPKHLAASSWELDIAGKRYPAAVSLRPMYDPDNARVLS